MQSTYSSSLSSLFCILLIYSMFLSHKKRRTNSSFASYLLLFFLVMYVCFHKAQNTFASCFPVGKLNLACMLVNVKIMALPFDSKTFHEYKADSVQDISAQICCFLLQICNTTNVDRLLVLFCY